jgi:hypothetical protein
MSTEALPRTFSFSSGFRGTQEFHDNQIFNPNLNPRAANSGLSYFTNHHAAQSDVFRQNNDLPQSMQPTTN